MKSLILTASLVLLSISSVQAEEDGSRERGMKHGFKHRGDPVAHLTERLDLTESQADEIAAIFEDSRAQHKAVQSSVKDEHCAIRENTILELSNVLNEEQMQEFESLQAKRKNSGRNHGMPRYANCDT